MRAVICEADSFPPPSLTTILTGGGEDYGVLGGLLLGPLCFWGTPKRGYGDPGLCCVDIGVTCVGSAPLQRDRGAPRSRHQMALPPRLWAGTPGPSSAGL